MFVFYGIAGEAENKAADPRPYENEALQGRSIENRSMITPLIYVRS